MYVFTPKTKTVACLTGIVGTECSGHGTCNFTSGLCACNSNWEVCVFFFYFCFVLQGFLFFIFIFFILFLHFVCLTYDNNNNQSPDCAANLCGEYDFCTSYFRGKCNTTKGTCTCYSPYFGNSCENTNCTQPCVHGTCLYQK